MPQRGLAWFLKNPKNNMVYYRVISGPKKKLKKERREKIIMADYVVSITSIY